MELPDELWLYILRLACTDGGSTGRALALACKGFQALSGQFRLYSIVVQDCQSLEMLLNHLIGLPSHRSRICHLLIAIPTPETIGPTKLFQYVAEINQIITLCAPTLKTLTIHMSIDHPGDWLSIPSITYPLLRELTLPTGCLLGQVVGEPSAPGFPNLRRFHSIQASPYITNLLLELPQGAPYLVDLRISHVDQAHDLAALIAELCNIPTMNAASSLQWQGVAVVRRFENVERVVVGTVPLYQEYELHRQCIENLKRLDAETRSGRTRVTHCDQTWDGFSFEHVRAEWLEGVEGGDGGWATVLDPKGMEVAKVG